VTKKNKRETEALRRLGVKLEPDPHYYCHHRTYGDRCNRAPTKMRENRNGVRQWYCAMHDPVRLYHKKREAEKRARWQRP
jgi:hypothetical protein